MGCAKSPSQKQKKTTTCVPSASERVPGAGATSERPLVLVEQYVPHATSHAASFRACDCSIVLLTWRCCLCCCCCSAFAVVVASERFPFDFVFWRRHAVFCLPGDRSVWAGSKSERERERKRGCGGDGTAIAEFFVFYIFVLYLRWFYSRTVSLISRGKRFFASRFFTIFTVYATRSKGRGRGLGGGGRSGRECYKHLKWSKWSSTRILNDLCLCVCVVNGRCAGGVLGGQQRLRLKAEDCRSGLNCRPARFVRFFFYFIIRCAVQKTATEAT